MKALFAIGVAMLAVGLVGCQGDGEDPNYKVEVKKSDADIAKEKTLMNGQNAPGTVTPGQPINGGGGAPAPGAMRKPGRMSGG